jgi:hypothetical protein
VLESVEVCLVLQARHNTAEHVPDSSAEECHDHQDGNPDKQNNHGVLYQTLASGLKNEHKNPAGGQK